MSNRTIQITSGRGPLECCRVVYKVQQLLLAEAAKLGLQAELTGAVKAEKPHTFYSATIKLSGQVPGSFLEAWQGSILWIGKSPFRPHHKRKNWFVGVEVFGEAPSAQQSQGINTSDSLHFPLPEEAVRFETFRASGPGGQNVNKVETAVRATHLASGLQVQVMDSRSQLENKKIAMRRLEEKLLQVQQQEQARLQQSQWNEHNSLERGNPVRTIKGAL